MTLATPTWAIAILGLILGCSLVWSLLRIGEARLRAASKFAARSLLLLMHAALFLIAIAIHVDRPSNREATLVTPSGFQADTIELFGTVFHLAGVANPPRGSQQVANLNELARREPGLDTLHVVGDGLRLPEWEEAPAWKLDYSMTSYENGIASLHWPRETETGQQVSVVGRVVGIARQAWARIVRPSGVVVAQAELDADSPFELSWVPRLSGPQLYSLEIVDGADEIIESEPIPVLIAEPQPPHVLFHLSRPSFEANTLKRWLHDQGASVTTVVQLGQGVSRTETSGEAAPQPALSANNLDQVDLLIMDSGFFTEVAVHDVLRSAVTRGLGLLILPTDDPTKKLPPQWTELLSAQPASDNVDSTFLSGQIGAARSAWTWQLKNARPLLADDTDRGVIHNVVLGRGRVTLSELTNTTNWQRTSKLYDRLWSDVVESTARAYWTDSYINKPTIPTVVNRRLAHCDATSEPHNCDTVWADEAGWQTLSASLGPIYVGQDANWQSWRAQLRQQETLIRSQYPGAKNAIGSSPQPWIDSWWLWLIFVLASAGLWLVEKFGQTTPTGAA